MKNISVIISSAILTTVLSLASDSVFAAVVDSEVKKSHYKNNESSSRHHKMKHHFKKLARQLNLTDEQQEKIKAIHAAQNENKTTNKANMTAFRDEVKNLLMSSTFDEQAFLNLHNQQQSQFSQMALARAKAKHAVMQILNEEQQDKMLTMKRKGKGHHPYGLF